MRGLLCPSLIGRSDELGELTRTLDDAAQARGSVVFVSGEAGIGKTRLVQETTAAARQRSFKVLSGRATIPHSTIAFRPLTEALFSYFRDAGPPDLAELEPFRPALARLVPVWAPSDAPDGGEVSVVVLAEAILRLLRALSRESGCLVVLEDLHWADPETLSIVEYLAENLTSEAVMLLCTVRSEEPSSAATLAHALAARRTAPTIAVGRLDPNEVSAMASACLASADVPSAVDAMLLASADGLPFFVEELLAGAAGSGALTQHDEGWVVQGALVPDIPQTFRDSVEARLNALEDAADIIVTAAVLGRSFDWTLLPAITGHDEAAVLQALRGAAQAQLLVTDVSNGGSFIFRHALTREAVAGRLLPVEWSALALRALHALEEAHPGLPGDLCDLAARYAERGGDRRRAAELMLESGRRSLARGALASAEDALVRAQALADGEAAADVAEARCEVLSLLGDATSALAEGATLIAALRNLDAAPSRIGRVHLWLARAAAGAGWWDVVDEHVQSARACAVLASDDELTERASAIGADLLINRGDARGAADLAAEIVVRASELGLPDLGCEALQVVGRAARTFDIGKAEAAFAQSQALAERHGLAVWSMRALQELGTIDLISGGGNERMIAAREVALAHGAIALAAQVDFQHALWNLDRHQLDAAATLAQRVIEIARPFGMRSLTAMSLTIEGCAHGWRGDRERMEALLSDAMAIAGDELDIVGCVFSVARMVSSLTEEDRGRAIEEGASGMDAFRASGTSLPAPERGLWALLTAVTGDNGRAAVDEVYASGVTEHSANRGFVHYAEAVLMGRAGDHAGAEGAVTAGDAALGYSDFYRHLGRRWLAEAAIADGWGEPATWLREALVDFEDREQDRLASAVRSLLARAGAPVPRRREDSSVPAALRQIGVTDREYEVLGLLAQGLANKEIAERLYLSPRTVERHIANVTVKAGVRTRSELVAFAAKNA